MSARSRPLISLMAVMLMLALTGCATGAATVGSAASATAAAAEEVVVYRSQFCTCCKGHIAHLEESGFAVRDEVVEDIAAVKDRLGVPGKQRSCHTSVVGDYFVEGHVPADVISTLLDERPKIDGIALPGMPSGAPGMPGEPEKLKIVSVRDGAADVYAVR